MTTKRIVFSRPDGGVSIIVPMAEKIAQFKTETEGVEAVKQSDVPSDATDVQIVESSDLLSDRTFRGAWERGLSANPILVNMTKARDIHMARIRTARTPEFQRLDADWMKAVGQNNQTEADRIEAERQVLRDLPQTFDLSGASTPDELKVLWPADLPKV